MKTIYPALLATGILCSSLGYAAPGKPKDLNLAEEVQKAIEEFNSRKNAAQEPENEVVVVLPPPTPSPAAEQDEEPAQAIPVEEPIALEEPSPGPGNEPGSTKADPKLVTGKPPVEDPSDTAGEPEDTEIADNEPETVTSPETEPVEKEGLGIRVESIRDGSGNVDPGQVELKASFPAKVLSHTPDGWRLEKSEHAPTFHEEVTLRPGKTISLNISPHILAPASDGMNTFAVVEPGFDVSEGYRQSNTVSAILGSSVAQLDRDALLLGNAISDLHQLLASLPKQEPETEEPTEP
jgi:hypothetical protein